MAQQSPIGGQRRDSRRESVPAIVAHVAFVLVLGFLLARADYEERVYARLVEHVRKTANSPEQVAVGLTSTVHELMISRNEIWGGPPLGGVYDTMFRAVSHELNVPTAACGSFCSVLVKAIQSAGINARFAQMTTADGVKGGHIMVEAEIEPGRWAVLGPLYDISFKRPDGSLASFSDVQQNFDYYKPQLPANWGESYRFQEVRYTNWEKIPVVLPALRTVLSWFMDKESLRTFCLRAYLTNVFGVYAILLCLAYAAFLLISILWRLRLARHGFASEHADGLIEGLEGSGLPQAGKAHRAVQDVQTTPAPVAHPR